LPGLPIGIICGTILRLGLGPLLREGFGMEKRILLVDDDGAFREVFTHALREALAPEQLDVTFVEAGTLAEARTRLREGGLDAALIDVTMPDGDGLDLVGEIHDGGVGEHIPTLVLTASLETSVAGRAMEAGAQGAFSKMASVPETAGAIIRLTESGSSEA
jgi:CheY-like chemotaxis protein